MRELSRCPIPTPFCGIPRLKVGPHGKSARARRDGNNVCVCIGPQPHKLGGHVELLRKESERKRERERETGRGREGGFRE